MQVYLQKHSLNEEGIEKCVEFIKRAILLKINEVINVPIITIKHDNYKDILLSIFPNVLCPIIIEYTYDLIDVFCKSNILDDTTNTNNAIKIIYTFNFYNDTNINFSLYVDIDNNTMTIYDVKYQIISKIINKVSEYRHANCYIKDYMDKYYNISLKSKFWKQQYKITRVINYSKLDAFFKSGTVNNDFLTEVLIIDALYDNLHNKKLQ